MNRLTPAVATTVVWLAVLTGPAPASATTTQHPTDSQYVWDLTELFEDVQDWETARQQAMQAFPRIEKRRGTLGDSAEDLYETLALVSDTLRAAGRVYVYASLNADEDLRNAETQERRQLAQIMLARFQEATAWIQPELLEVGRDAIDGFLNDEPRLGRFSYQLDNSLRNAPYTLGSEAEQALAFFFATVSGALHHLQPDCQLRHPVADGHACERRNGPGRCAGLLPAARPAPARGS